jgi:DNA invertase Pin-like site-specific DNA recombinase
MYTLYTYYAHNVNFEINDLSKTYKIEFDYIYSEQISGKVKIRPQLDNLLKTVRSGDIIFIDELSRIGRNLLQVLNILKELDNLSVIVIFVKKAGFEGIDGPMKEIVRTLLCSFIELEYNLRKDCQLEGIALAKLKGKYNRISKLKLPKNWDQLLDKYFNQTKYFPYTMVQLAKDANLCYSTVKKRIREIKQQRLKNNINLE